MEILSIPTGALDENCYFIIDNQELIMIDPGDDFDKLYQIIKAQQLNPLAILLTHAHFDHFGAASKLLETFDIPLYLHPAERDWLMDATFNLSLPFMNQEVTCFVTPHCINEGPLTIGPFHFQVIETPGHSPGGLSFYIENALFTGDALFYESVGRTDFFEGNSQQLIDSLKNKLLPLDETLIVYPGHGNQTTLKHEKLYNPYLQ